MRSMRTAKVLAVALGAALIGALAPHSQGAESTTYGFETCLEGWKTGDGAGWQRQPLGDGSSWALGNPEYLTAGDMKQYIASPPHRWGGGKMTVTYSIRWNHEPPETSLGADNVMFEWSRDAKKWTRVKTHGADAAVNKDFPLYTKEKATFDAPAGTVQIRFRMNSDANLGGAGPWVDLVVVPTAKPDTAKC